MSLDKEKHGSALGGQPQQINTRLDTTVAHTKYSIDEPELSLADPPMPVDECSILIEALCEFAPKTREVVYSEQSDTRSLEIESEEVWERFEAAIQPNDAKGLHAFLTEKLRYWIDLHHPSGHCLLHLTMASIPHDVLNNVFMAALAKRLDAIPTLFPDNEAKISYLCEEIQNMGSGSFPQLKNKTPDSSLCFKGPTWGVPAFILEVDRSQKWATGAGVKNKAIQYEDDSKGTVNMVLYLGLGERCIGVIGSRSIFPDCPLVKYLDGTLSTYAVEVIPLTSLTDATYAECLLPFRFAHFGPGAELLTYLEPGEEDIGFSFTFKEILQMMEWVDKICLSTPLPINQIPHPSRSWSIPQENARRWISSKAIQASLFSKPPVSPAYYTVQPDVQESIEDDSSAEKDDSSSDKEWTG